MFAMKAMDKTVMMQRNKVHRARAERDILALLDHPFLPTLYSTFQTQTHICLITDFCPGGELFLLLERQPRKVFTEDVVRFFAAEVVIALEYLHCVGSFRNPVQLETTLHLTKGVHFVTLHFMALFLRRCCVPRLEAGECVASGGRAHSVDGLRLVVLDFCEASGVWPFVLHKSIGVW